jgi:hypothetical protein
MFGTLMDDGPLNPKAKTVEKLSAEICTQPGLPNAGWERIKRALRRDLPTTITYGLMAQDFIRVMQEAGVEFMRLDGATPRRGEVRVDWDWLIALDSLIDKPPRSLGRNLKLVGWLDQKVDVLKRLWAGAG